LSSAAWYHVEGCGGSIIAKIFRVGDHIALVDCDVDIINFVGAFGIRKNSTIGSCSTAVEPHIHNGDSGGGVVGSHGVAAEKTNIHWLKHASDVVCAIWEGIYVGQYVALRNIALRLTAVPKNRGIVALASMIAEVVIACAITTGIRSTFVGVISASESGRGVG
jgi:hypothetical protein